MILWFGSLLGPRAAGTGVEPTPPAYQFSFVLGSNSPATLQVLFFNLTEFSELYSGAYAKEVTSLSELRVLEKVVAIASATDDTLQAEQFTVNAFTPFGDPFSLPATSGSMAISRLTEFDKLAYRDDQTDDLRAVFFDNPGWHIEGDPEVIAGDTASIAFMELGTDAVWCNDILQTYVFIDPDWQTDGNPYALVAGVGEKVAIAGWGAQDLEPVKRITALNSGTGELSRLSFDGTNWSMDGSALNIGTVANTCSVLMHAHDFAVVLKDAAIPVLQAYWYRDDLNRFAAFGDPFPLTIGSGLTSMASIIYDPTRLPEFLYLRTIAEKGDTVPENLYLRTIEEKENG